MLAALTSRRSLVQIQPGLLTFTPVAQRPRHLPDVEASAGSSPAGGTAEWTGAWFQHGLISRPTPVQIRPPQLAWSGSVEAERRPGKRVRSGSTPGWTSRINELLPSRDYVTDDVPALLGRPARSFEQFITDFAAAFS